MAVNFSIGMKDIDPKPNNIAGRFILDRTKCNFKFLVLNMEKFDFIINGEIILPKNNSLKNLPMNPPFPLTLNLNEI